MSKIKKIKNDSLYKVKDENEECDNLEVAEYANAETGDSTSPNASPEYAEAQQNAQKFIESYKAKTPSDYTEVTEDTLIHYFGKNWDGNFPKCDTVVERRTSEVATQIYWYDNILGYLSNPNNVPSGLTKYSNIVARIRGTYSGMIKDVQDINSSFFKLKNFKFQTENPMAILNSTDYVLANLEYMFTKIDHFTDYIIDGWEKAKGWVEGIDFESWGGFCDSVTEKVHELWDNLADNLANLPGTLLNKFLNCAFVQNMLNVPLRILGFIAQAVITISTIKAPTSLKDVIAIFGILRKAVSQLKNAWQVIQDAINQVKQVANMIKKGNWIGMLGMLNKKGNAKGPSGFKMVEKPSSFAAKYPQNSAYTTPGGHTIEVDNTTGHERLHIEHKSGTSFEIATDGDLLGKVRKNFQTMVTGDCEISTQGNMSLHAKKKLELTFSEPIIDTSKDVNFTGANITLTSGMMPGNFLSTGAYATYIGSIDSTTVTSGLSTSLTSFGLVDISTGPEGAILLSAPWIVIDTLQLTMLTGLTEIGSIEFLSLCGSTSIMVSYGVNNLVSTGINNVRAPVNIIGGL